MFYTIFHLIFPTTCLPNFPKKNSQKFSTNFCNLFFHIFSYFLNTLSTLFPFIQLSFFKLFFTVWWILYHMRCILSNKIRNKVTHIFSSLNTNRLFWKKKKRPYNTYVTIETVQVLKSMSHTSCHKAPIPWRTF